MLSKALETIAILMFFWSIVGLLWKKATFNSRGWALFIFGLVFPIFALSMDLTSAPNDKSFGLILTIFILLFIAIVLFRVSIKAFQVLKGRNLDKDGIIERLAFHIAKVEKKKTKNEIEKPFINKRARQYIPVKNATISQKASARKSPYIDYGNGDEYHAIQNDNRWYEGETGKGAKFEYSDHYGEVTEREVRNWVSNGPYIKAFCLLRHENRSFRKDRIENWEEV